MTGREPLLDVSDLRVELGTPDGHRPVLRGLDLRLGPGETVALVGESGAGKTIAVLALLGLLPPRARVAAARLRVAGHELGPDGPAGWEGVRGRVLGLVPQDVGTALDPTCPVGAQVAEVAAHHHALGRRAAWAEAEAWLARVGLDPRVARWPPHRLSGGMRQRVLVALALAARPAVLVADEPTSALDPVSAARLLELLRGLQQELGLGLLVVSHDLGEVAAVAERVVVLYAGEVVESGPVGAVFARPAHPYTAALLRAIPLGPGGPAGPLAGLPGEPPAPGTLPGCPFAPRCPEVVRGCLRAPAPRLTLGPDRMVRCWLHHPEAPRRRPRPAAVGAPPVPEARGPVCLEAQGLTKVYRGPGRGATPAVDGVGFDLRHGEVLALVGESGAGKSSLVRLVVRLERPTSGRLWWRGQDALALRGAGLAAFRRAVRPILQGGGASLDPRLTVEDLVAEGLPPGRAGRRARVVEALEAVGLGAWALRRTPVALSGGERQRVAIARALVGEPEVLVADEPFAGLDAPRAAAVARLLQDLVARRGLALLLVTHHVPLALHLARRLGVMLQGRLVELGPALDLWRAPAHPYTAALWSAVPLPDPILARSRPPAPEVPSDRPAAGCPYAPLCPRAEARCWEEMPDLRPTGALGRQVACHHPLA